MTAKHALAGQEPLFAVSAEFTSPEALLEAARALRGLSHGKLNIYSPVPLEGAIAALGSNPQPIPKLMALGAFVVGFAAMMGMCVYASAYDYVFNIGGRPLVSWPAFVVPSVSFATLLAAAVVFFNMTFLNRLPLLNHPAFNIPHFLRATQDRFFLTVEPSHDAFEPGVVIKALDRLALRPLAIHQVPR